VTDVRGKLKFQIFGILVNVTVKDTKFWSGHRRGYSSG
jgi:hypothetical protein